MKQDINNTANSNQLIKPYKKDSDYSYTLGAFPTFELLKTKSEQAVKVLADPSFTDMEHLRELCKEKKVTLEINPKLISKLSDKDNCYVVGIFNKYESKLDEDKPHIVLVNPSNMGNLGTILRTSVGFGINNIAIILPGADVFHPKTVRSSMGALFRLKLGHFNSFEEYQTQYGNHDIFTFMLDGEKTLTLEECPKSKLFTLVFGNEATGLDPSFSKIGTSIFIPQSPEVDSLNLTIAVGIGAYVFTNHAK
ncbi:MAG: TrmH family RNA methyltransferase [Mobilitalea sp.]